MDLVLDILGTVATQFQSPTLAFLMGGMLIAAMGSKLEIPAPVYSMVVTLLLLKVGLSAGISVREADLGDLLLPALGAMGLGIGIVLLGGATLARMRGVPHADGMATVGLFGAVSASTLAAGMVMLEDAGVAYEGFIGALYPFMDVAALVTAIVLGRMALARSAHGAGGGTMVLGGSGGGGGGAGEPGLIRRILVDTLRSPAISALVLGLVLGLLARPDPVYETFYEPIFRGLLSILMLIMGMEAWARLSELSKVAHAYLAYGLLAPVLHGLMGLAVGVGLHHATGFSGGGVVLLAVMAASSSDISGPPTMRGALPEANPSAYVGTSTGIGTPVAILCIPLFMAIVDAWIGL
ncbi:sodium-dependent bicarbonate transport family permease [Jannaschia sp. Os4]|uniref:sodium-dependent bicarbonate transport family permease n=1 Tax=Jannaschia sp. Os4 TaxID=2807617 RepID=UPI001939AC58|nr:sodium-dependent bicarbonate transport family permease [Jannaschia sp. Os4]MBM2576136.1 sodium-dependent bicarbonate transport family permease [Jannaschia sp. Os4]